jgi:hypothetical protein
MANGDANSLKLKASGILGKQMCVIGDMKTKAVNYIQYIIVNII